eukprot:490281_1
MENFKLMSAKISPALKIFGSQWKKNKIFRLCTVIIGGVTFIAVTNHLYYRLYRIFYNSPHGPVGIPLFGSLFSLASGPISFYSSLCINYGPIVSYNLGLKKCVAITDYETAHMLWMDDSFGTAKYVGGFDHQKHLSFAIMKTSNEMWNRRKLAQSVLLTLINSKYIDKMAPIILNKFVYPVLDKEPTQCKLRTLIKNTVFNLTFSAVFGQNAILASDDKDFITYADLTWNVFESSGPSVLVSLIFGADNSIAKYIRSKLYSSKQYAAALKSFYELNLKYYKIHNQTENNEETYIQRINDKKNSLSFEYNEFEILNDIAMMMIAGNDTTTNALEFMLVLIARHPKIQQEIYNQLKLQFKSDSEVNLNTLNCSLLKAFMWECFRLYPAAAHSLFRVAPKNIKINKYNVNINKGDLVMINTFDMNRDINCVNGLVEGKKNEINLDLWLDKKTSQFKKN